MAVDGGGDSTRSNGKSATEAHPLDERYYVRGETEASGPYEGRIIKEMIEQGKLLANAGLARVGATEWIKIKDHPFFASLLQPGSAMAAGSTQSFRLPGAPGSYLEVASETRRYAGFWIRVAAYLVDMIIILVGYSIIIGIVFAIFGVSNFNYSGDRSDSAGQTAAIIGLIVAYAAIFAFVILYQVLFLRSRWQATPGKRLLGLHIVTLSGEPVSGWRALGRYLCYAVSSSILCIGFMMAGWTKEKRAFHDSICDTRVVHGRL